jgi:hypothetical protein
MVETSLQEADWGRNWSSSFYLNVETSSYSYKANSSIDNIQKLKGTVSPD